MGRFSSVLLVVSWLGLAAANAQESPFFHEAGGHETGENSPLSVASDVSLQHHHRPALFPALNVAVTTAAPAIMSPQEAVGQASFKMVDGRLVHGNSGLKCPGNHKLRMRESEAVIAEVSLFRVVAYKPNGTDVSCGYINKERNFIVTIFASEWADMSLNDHFYSSAEIMLTQETPFGSEVQVPVMAPSPAAKSTLAEDTMALAYDGQPGADGMTLREALWLNKSRNWHVKVRSTHTPPADEPLVLSMFIFSLGLENVALDRGVLSNKLVNNATDDDDQVRAISWTTR